MAISEITQNREFDKDWIRARNEDELRDLVHLYQRRRIRDVYCRFEHQELADPEMKLREYCDISSEPGFLSGKYLELEAFYGLPLLDGFDRDRFITHCIPPPGKEKPEQDL